MGRHGYNYFVLPKSFYTQDAISLAQALLGCELVRQSPQGVTAGIIVETEAYRADDEASHSFRGQTKRNAVMFGPGGHAYVYFTYGMHYCFNVVAGTDQFAEAVLIRALKPTWGLRLMEHRRDTSNLTNLCSGPGKLAQAMDLTKEQNGLSLNGGELFIRQRRAIPKVVSGPRIGIRAATDKPWRFFISTSAYVSKHKFNGLKLNA